MSTWPRTQLRRVFQVVNGGTPTADPANWDGEVSWATPIDLARVDGGVLTSTDRSLTPIGLATGSRAVPRGSIIVSTRAPIGYVAEAACDMAFNQGCRGLVPVTECDSRYFRYQVLALAKQLNAFGQGSTFVELSGDALAAVPLVVPPVSEQRAIADFLDTETARIDALITKKRRMVALLEERWRTTVRHRMQELSQRHGQVALKRLVRCLDGRRIPLRAEDRAVRRGPFPYFGASGQIDCVDAYLFDEVLVLLGEDGAQLADPDCEISFVVSGPVWVNNHAHVLRPLGMDPWLLAMHLSTVDRALVISGATREKITQSDMDNIPVPDVPIRDQQEVSNALRELKTRSDKCVVEFSAQISLIREHRQALITAAVTGELDIPGVAA